jgi:hypothetical protein
VGFTTSARQCPPEQIHPKSYKKIPADAGIFENQKLLIVSTLTISHTISLPHTVFSTEGI